MIVFLNNAWEVCIRARKDYKNVVFFGFSLKAEL